MKDKKAIGTILMLMGTTLIVFFIMMFYLIFTLTISVTGKGSEISLSESGNNLYTVKGFFSFLNTNIEYNGEVSVRNAIINSAERYNNIENDQGDGLLDKQGIKALGVILDVEFASLRRKMLDQGFDNSDWEEYLEFRREDQEVLVPLFVEELNNYCDEFYLSIPQGLVTKDGLKDKILGESIFTDERTLEDYIFMSKKNDKFTPIIKNVIIINDDFYELKFRNLKTC